MELKNTHKTEIPIFFSTDDNYIPYLDVAISSLIANASKSFNYKIIILNTGLDEVNLSKIKLNEKIGFNIAIPFGYKYSILF